MGVEQSYPESENALRQSVAAAAKAIVGFSETSHTWDEKLEYAAQRIQRCFDLSSASAQTPIIYVQPMGLSDNRTDYWVSIKVGDRKITPYVFRDEQFKAEYEAASFRWLLLGEPKPDLMAYSEAGWPASSVPSTDRNECVSC